MNRSITLLAASVTLALGGCSTMGTFWYFRFFSSRYLSAFLHVLQPAYA